MPKATDVSLTSDKSLLFCTPAYRYLRDALLSDSRAPGAVERTSFPDGERLLRLMEDVQGRDVVLIGGTIDDEATLEIYDLATGAVLGGARRLTLVLPYFGYSTMERSVRPGEIVTAKTRARLLSSIPQASLGNRVLLLDLHSEGIPHYFEGHMRVRHLYAKPIIKEAALDFGRGGRESEPSFSMACTDAGRAKWVESLANELGVGAAFVFKRRLSGSDTEVMAASARVEGKDVVIYDDMIRTGGSLIQAAEAYRDAGARRMIAIATHCLLPAGALQRLEDSGLFEAVVVTDSHPRARLLANSFLRVESVAPVISPFLD